MIYLDSSALLKLLVDEPESAALATWLAAQAQPIVSSELAKLEVVRAMRRVDPAAASTARGLMAQVDLVPLTGVIVDDAADVDGPSLRSLDAIHLASALAIREVLTAFVVYDHRLAAAARAAGLPVIQPA